MAFRYRSIVQSVQKDIKDTGAVRVRRAALHVRKKLRAKARSKRVSSPGNPPGRLSGRFYRSIKVAHFANESFIGSRSPVAHLLEFGTQERETKAGRYSGRMAPRPLWIPTFREEADTVAAILSDRWFG